MLKDRLRDRVSYCDAKGYALLADHLGACVGLQCIESVGMHVALLFLGAGIDCNNRYELSY